MWLWDYWVMVLAEKAIFRAIYIYVYIYRHLYVYKYMYLILPLKKHVTMTIYICLTSNSRWYGNPCALEASLNKTNFPFILPTKVTGAEKGLDISPLTRWCLLLMLASTTIGLAVCERRMFEHYAWASRISKPQASSDADRYIYL